MPRPTPIPAKDESYQQYLKPLKEIKNYQKNIMTNGLELVEMLPIEIERNKFTIENGCAQQIEHTATTIKLL